MSWFLATRLGRWVSAALAGAALLVAAYWRGRQEGSVAAETRVVRSRVEAMKEAQEVRDDVEKRGDAAARDDLARWMRD